MIQQRLESRGLLYRFVVYGDGTVYRPLEFSSQTDLVQVVRCLLPEFREGVLPARTASRELEIIFTADVLVDDSQLRKAGLSNGA